MNLASLIQEETRRHERRQAILNLLSEAAEYDPGFLQEVQRAIGESNGKCDAPHGESNRPDSTRRRGRPVLKKKRQRSEADTNFDRICQAFTESGGDWLELSEVAAKSGLEAYQVEYIRKKSHSPHFESKPHPDHGKKVLLRLKKDER